MFLITGFEPFTTGRGLRLATNPTAAIARSLGETLPHATGAVLPVSFKETKEALRALYREVEPAHWIGMGFAPHRETIDIEVIALNVEHAPTGDNDGDTPSMRPVIEGAPLAYRAVHDLRPLCEALDGHGAAAQLNFHAGTFLCNQVFYLGCHEVVQSTLATATFIHVPPMAEYQGFKEALARYVITGVNGRKLNVPA